MGSSDRNVRDARSVAVNDSGSPPLDAAGEVAHQFERYARWQETLADIGQVALASDSLSKLMDAAAGKLAEMLAIEFVEILELDPTGKYLMLTAAVGWPRDLIGHAKAEANTKSQGGFTLLSREPVVVIDLKAERRFTPPPLLTDYGIVSGITVAIGGRQPAYGVLGIHSRSARQFNTDDVHFLNATANVLGTAVRVFDADQAQRDSAARVQAIVNTLVDGVITIDEQGTIESLNPAAEQIFGYTAAEVIGRNVNVLMPEPYHHEHDSYLRNYLRSGQKRIIGIGREVSGLRKDGTTFPMDLAVGELQVSGRRMFTGVVRDITERRRMEREILEIGAAEQQRIGQDLHDGLCQHLAGIAFATEVLSKKLIARSAPEAPNIAKIGEMIDQAITQARDLARGLQPVTVEASGLVDALERLAEKVEAMFHVSCLLVCDGPCHVYDNIVGTHLYRIAQEAITNAVKHGQAHTIVIELNVSGDQLVMAIRDDGVGLTVGSGTSQGMGLRSMEYRARVIGGILTVQPGERGGTAVVCIVRLRGAGAVAQEGSKHGEKGCTLGEAKDPDSRGGRPSDRPRTSGGVDQSGA